MNPLAKALQNRLLRFAIDVVRFVRRLPTPDQATRDIGGQLIRAATSTSANYRAACRGRSHAEFTAKLGTSLEEVDESEHWLEIIRELPLSTEPEVARLLKEAGELRAILKASHDTAVSKRDRLNQTRRTSINKS